MSIGGGFNDYGTESRLRSALTAVAVPTSVSNGVADATSSIQSTINKCAAAGGGVVALGHGTYKVTAQLNVPVNVQLVGEGSASTTINHTANGVCIKYGGTGTFSHHGMSIEGIKITGNNGGSATGINLGDFYNASLRDVVVTGYTAGIGIRLYNQDYWSEGLYVERVRVQNCARGFCFHRKDPGSAYDSFGYTKIRDLSINVPANGIGMQIGNPSGGMESLVYNSHMRVTFWLDDNGVGIETTANGNFTGELWLTGEMEGGGTNGTLVDCDGGMLYTGNVFAYPDAFATVLGGSSPPVKRITVGDSTLTSLEPVISGGLEPATQSFAGLGAVSAANQASLVAWGYDYGDNPVFQVASRPYTANASDRWDTTGQMAFEVLADGGITCYGNYVQFGNGTFWYSASGSPEGVVTAPVGSLYTRTDGGATTTLYVKTSGSGNTGWTAK